ncbi:hypothetical protein CKY47_29840 [Saccharothrix yanglingensis]|uniref:Uncharacterized protein n=1 Tax=Saccharothrix yanglingensis TaxID=659496 RepID=A0ABU0X8S1_9PSEU|nr:hypothetical protein [Saccharothrix yanglingensis]
MASRPHRDRVTFAGDLLLRLATDGRLVLEPAEADRVIAELERTLEEVTGRLRVVDLLRGTSLPALRRVHPELEQAVVDAVFDEQVTDGGLRRALDELPKYIEALRKAGKPESPAGP